MGFMKATLSSVPVRAQDSSCLFTKLHFRSHGCLRRGRSASASLGADITDADGYIRVERSMRVQGIERMYAAGDAVSFSGPKMGHMAVRQGEVAAANVAAEIAGEAPDAEYNHEVMMVIDEGGQDAIYLHQKLWMDEPASVRQGRFWSWAKRIHEKYWQRQHA